MAIMSLVSLAVSVLGFVVFAALFYGFNLIWLFVILSIVSVILPPIAKMFRLTQAKKSKTSEILAIIFEIVAIILGGFNLACVLMYLTPLPAYFSYLGWVVCGTIYVKVKPTYKATDSDKEFSWEKLSQQTTDKDNY